MKKYRYICFLTNKKKMFFLYKINKQPFYAISFKKAQRIRKIYIFLLLLLVFFTLSNILYSFYFINLYSSTNVHVIPQLNFMIIINKFDLFSVSGKFFYHFLTIFCPILSRCISETLNSKMLLYYFSVIFCCLHFEMVLFKNLIMLPS